MFSGAQKGIILVRNARIFSSGLGLAHSAPKAEVVWISATDEIQIFGGTTMPTVNRLTLSAMYALFIALAGLALPLQAASVTYQYQGNEYNNAFGDYTTDMFISGWFTVNFPGSHENLPMAERAADVSAFSFDDGVRTLTQSDGVLSPLFQFSTGADGNILSWIIALNKGFLNAIGTSDDPQAFRPEAGDYDLTMLWGMNVGSNTEQAGTWTIGAVPLPSAVWLFGSSLLGIIGISRRKKIA